MANEMTQRTPGIQNESSSLKTSEHIRPGVYRLTIGLTRTSPKWMIDNKATLLTATLSIMWLISCNETTTARHDMVSYKPATKLVVQLEFDVQLKNGIPSIKGTTNLPDGTQLQASVSPEDEYEADDLIQNRDIVVTGNNFSATGIVPDIGVWPIGSYSISVALFADVQKMKVFKVIGMNGSLLVGPLITAGDKEGSALFRTSKTVTLGDSSGIKAYQAKYQRENKQVLEYVKRIKEIIKTGRRMIAFRRSSTERSKCYTLQTEYQQIARKLAEEGKESIPQRFDDLRFAAIYANNCVMCAPEHAENACNILAERLKMNEKEMSKKPKWHGH